MKFPNVNESVRDLRKLLTDVLVIGSEGAGARAALAASEAGKKVAVITKGRVGKSGATQCIPGDYAINSNSACRLGLPGDPDDDWRKHYRDTLEAGKWLNDPLLAQTLAENAEDGLSFLKSLNVEWTRLGQYPGHSYPRSAMVGEVGKTGPALLSGLHRAMHCKDIALIEDTLAIELLVSEGRVNGCLAFFIPSGEFFVIEAQAVILATGGGSRIYWLTSGPEELTGDGMAMAYRAGAELIDMEFVQFSPFTIVWPSGLRGHMSFVYEYMCVLQSWLLNSLGERYMERWDPERMERSTRDYLSIGMMDEIISGRSSEHGGVYLSLSHLPMNLIDQFEAHHFPGLKVGEFKLSDFGVDPKEKAFEIAPGAHYFMGGVRIDGRGATTVPGLFAAGEVTGGVHGANRISGNAITDTQVFGAIAGAAAAEYCTHSERIDINADQVIAVINEIEQGISRSEGVSTFNVRGALQQTAWNQVGVIRNKKGLEQALSKIHDWEDQVGNSLCIRTKDPVFNIELIKAIELKNMLIVLQAITMSALSRDKTCGAHFRSDSNEQADASHRYITRCESGKMTIISLPAPETEQ